MKQILKTLKALLICVLIVIITYLSAAILGSILIVNRNFTEPETGIPIYITSNGVHTSFILPTEADNFNWKKFVPISDFSPQCLHSKYICFGWGNKEFYMNTPEWKNIRLKTLARAAIPSETALSVRYLNYQPQESENTLRLSISANQYAELTSYIASSFQFDSSGNIIKSQNKTMQFEQFYNGLGHYSAFFTCNNWTADGMKKAGISAPLWSPFDKGILYVLKRKSNL